jgi:hypothetical protein
MAKTADLIILGTVVGPSIGHFDPPFGNLETEALIVTDTAVQVECVLKGAQTEATIMVRTDGGCVGETCLYVSHGAQIRVGERAIMFLTHNEPDYVIVLQPNGLYEVQAGGEYYTFGNLFDISGDRIVSDFYSLTVAELLSIIENNIR